MAIDWGDIANPGKVVADAASSAISRNRNPLSASDEVSAIANEFGLDLNSLIGGGVTDEGPSAIETALAQAALEVSGVDLFTYGRGVKLPGWVPKELRQFATQNQSPLTGVYDPYHGMLDQGGDERVYMGEKSVPIRKIDPDDVPEIGHESKLYGDAYAEPRGEKTGKKKKRDRTVTYAQAMNMPYTWEDDEVSSAMQRFREAGINVRNFDELVAAWGGLVDRASKTFTMSLGERKVTPWDVLELNKREQEKAGTLVDYENGSQTQTATSVHEISEGASWQVLQATLSQLLGRDPSDQEVRDYAYRMNTLAARNPSITETVTRYKAGEAVSSESHTSGGFGADEMAREAYEGAQDDPEYAKVQGGTTYFNALLAGIGAIGDV